MWLVSLLDSQPVDEQDFVLVSITSEPTREPTERVVYSVRIFPGIVLVDLRLLFRRHVRRALPFVSSEDQKSSPKRGGALPTMHAHGHGAPARSTRTGVSAFTIQHVALGRPLLFLLGSGGGCRPRLNRARAKILPLPAHPAGPHGPRTTEGVQSAQILI